MAKELYSTVITTEDGLAPIYATFLGDTKKRLSKNLKDKMLSSVREHYAKKPISVKATDLTALHIITDDCICPNQRRYDFQVVLHYSKQGQYDFDKYTDSVTTYGLS